MKTGFGDNLFTTLRQALPVVRLCVRKHRVESLLFLLLWGTFAYFYQSTQQNEAARFDQTRAIALDHKLAIDDYWWNSADVIRYHKNGQEHIYPNKAPGTTLLAVPVFWLLTHLLKPVMAAGLPEWIYWHAVTYLTILLTIGLVSALAAIATYRVLKCLTDDPGFSVFAVLAIWLGTMAFPFSTLFFSHQLAAALLAISFWLLFTLRREALDGRTPLDQAASSEEPQTGASRTMEAVEGMVEERDSQPSASREKLRWFALVCLAGALEGFSVTTEYPTALLVAILSAYCLWVIHRANINWKAKGKLLAAYVVGLAAGGSFLVWYNLEAFGKVFYVPYEAYAGASSSFPVYSRGFLGMRWPGFGQFLHALAAITIKPPIGMLYIGVENWRVYASSPVLWLTLPGLAIMLWRRTLRPEGLVVAAMIVAYVLFLTSYGNSIYDWSGAAYIGPRHLVPLLPFLAFPIYYGGRKFKYAFYPLLAISIFYMLLATAVEPRVPYPFDNPPRDSFLPDYLHGRLAQNTDSLFDPEHRKLTVDSTAFNLAKLARVPRPYQLAPLMVWWFLIGGALLFVAAPRSQLTQTAGEIGHGPGINGDGFVDETSEPHFETGEPENVNHAT